MKFSINVDHVAFLRNARQEMEPDPVTFALMAEQAGVDGIVVHLREDRRHVNERDLRLMREMVTTKLDLEMAAVEDIIKIALDVAPDLVTLVPEKRQELTTEGGLNVLDNIDHLKDSIARFHDGGIAVSLFIEPDTSTIEASKEIGADFIEIHTGRYANASSLEKVYEELDAISLAAAYAKKLSLGVNAGHGLNYRNVKEFLSVENIDEVSIGQAVIARSLFVGLQRAVGEMIGLLKG